MKIVTIVIDDSKLPPDIYMTNHNMAPEEGIVALMQIAKNLAMEEGKKCQTSKDGEKTE